MRPAHVSLMTAGLLSLMPVVAASGSGPNGAEEFALRRLITAGSVPRIENAIVWSEAYPRPGAGAPRAGDNAAPSAVAGPAKALDKPARFVFADSADLAYEYGTFIVMSQRNSGTSTNAEGAYLRIWQKVAGQWKLAAEVRRPSSN